jgi:HEAT repeat protein
MTRARMNAQIGFDYHGLSNVIACAIASLVLALCSCNARSTEESIPTDVPYDIRVLIEKILSGSYKDRSEAITNLERAGNRAIPVIPYLIDKLGNMADVKVADGARLALKGVGEAAVGPLIAAIGVDKYKEQEPLIISLLGEIGDPRAIPALISVLEDANPEVRKQAAWALGHMPDQRSFQPLMRRLHDEDYRVVRNAIWALGEIGDHRAVEPVIALLIKKSKDPPNDVRDYAAFALGKLGDRRAFDPLLAVYQDKEYPDKDQPDSVLRNDALTALGRTRDPRAFEVLRLALKDGDVMECVAAVRGLAGLGDARSIAILEGILKDERPTDPAWKKPDGVELLVRPAAALALVSTGDDGAIDAVFEEYRASPETRITEDSEDSRKDIRFRTAVVDAMAMSPKPHAYLKVIDILQGTDMLMRQEAARVLKASTISSMFLLDTMPDERKKLAALDDERVLQALMNVAEGAPSSKQVGGNALKTSRETQKYAVAALRKSGNPEAMRFVEKLEKEGLDKDHLKKQRQPQR